MKLINYIAKNKKNLILLAAIITFVCLFYVITIRAEEVTQAISSSQLEQGMRKAMNIGDRVRFGFADQTYLFALVSSTSTNAEANFSFSQENLLFNVSEEKRFDLNSDGNDDLTITLDLSGVDSADFTFKTIRNLSNFSFENPSNNQNKTGIMLILNNAKNSILDLLGRYKMIVIISSLLWVVFIFIILLALKVGKKHVTSESVYSQIVAQQVEQKRREAEAKVEQAMKVEETTNKILNKERDFKELSNVEQEILNVRRRLEATKRIEEEMRKEREAAEAKRVEEERKRIERETERQNPEREKEQREIASLRRIEEERRKIEEGARRRVQERKLREEEFRRKQEEEEARRKEQEEMKKLEEIKLKLEQERKAFEEKRKRVEEEQRKKQEDEARRAAILGKIEEQRRKQEEERIRQEQERKKREEAQKKLEEERRKAEETRRREEEKARRKAEEEKRKLLEEGMKKLAALRREEEAERLRLAGIRKGEVEQKAAEPPKALEANRQEILKKRAEETRRREEEEARKIEEEKRLKEKEKSAIKEERSRIREQKKTELEAEMKRKVERKSFEEQFQKLAEERRKLEEERAKLEKLKAKGVSSIEKDIARVQNFENVSGKSRKAVAEAEIVENIPEEKTEKKKEVKLKKYKTVQAGGVREIGSQFSWD